MKLLLRSKSKTNRKVNRSSSTGNKIKVGTTTIENRTTIEPKYLTLTQDHLIGQISRSITIRTTNIVNRNELMMVIISSSVGEEISDHEEAVVVVGTVMTLNVM